MFGAVAVIKTGANALRLVLCRHLSLGSAAVALTKTGANALRLE
jgi:hypothetical protein